MIERVRTVVSNGLALHAKSDVHMIVAMPFCLPRPLSSPAHAFLHPGRPMALKKAVFHRAKYFFKLSALPNSNQRAPEKKSPFLF